MNTLEELGRRLRGLDNRGYKAYKQIKGRYDAERFDLRIDHVQGDPYAQPSRLRALLRPESAKLPAWATSTADRRRATADFLNRVFAAELGKSGSRRGSGRSGRLEILRPRQEVLERTSVIVDGEGAVEARFRAGLPARGRRILGGQAASMLTRDVPAAVRAGLLFESLDAGELQRHVEAVEDAVALRSQLEDAGLVAFVADDAILPRRSGVDDRPLASDRAVPFRSPDSLRITLDAPNAGSIPGMGVPAGITLIVGGGYHGKSTLLRAIERGVYDHVPGDGRERVVAVRSAVKVRAEDGRRIAGTDISSFIGKLPSHDSTNAFHSDNASGSTSQAAAIIEAIEVGATCLLLDEDTSATNFMIRDARMQALIADEHEPITPFIDRARQMYTDQGISTLLVVGGAGDYFDVADSVIAMRAYVPEHATEEARRIAGAHPTGRRHEGGDWRPPRTRVPLPRSLDPGRGRRRVNVKIRAADRVLFGTEEVDLGAVEQIVETAQTRAIAQAVVRARGNEIDGEDSLRNALEHIMESIDRDGLGSIHRWALGEYSRFRIFELAAFLNRIRSLEVRTAK